MRRSYPAESITIIIEFAVVLEEVNPLMLSFQQSFGAGLHQGVESKNAAVFQNDAGESCRPAGIFWLPIGRTAAVKNRLPESNGL